MRRLSIADLIRKLEARRMERMNAGASARELNRLTARIDNLYKLMEA